MSSESVTEWLENLRQGESQAAQRLWERYLAQLLRLARNRLGRRRSALVDEDVVVTDAFANFYLAIEAGRFSELADRDDLWRVLVMLTERRMIDQIRRERASKRGRGRTPVPIAQADESCQHGGGNAGAIHVTDGGPTPAFAAEAAEQLEILLKTLPDDAMRDIATAKLEGYVNQEIADRLNISLRSVERRLGLIRRIWTEHKLA